ncbi:hypothetical protein [Mesoaciditoga sp.]
MEKAILELLKTQAMTESQITEALLPLMDEKIIFLRNGNERSCEVRIALSNLVCAKKVFVKGEVFMLNASSSYLSEEKKC